MGTWGAMLHVRESNPKTAMGLANRDSRTPSSWFVGQRNLASSIPLTQGRIIVAKCGASTRRTLQPREWTKPSASLAFGKHITERIRTWGTLLSSRFPFLLVGKAT